MKGFAGRGPLYTQETIALSLDAVERHGISQIVVASNTGETALSLIEASEKRSLPLQIICVTHVTEFKAGCHNELPDEQRQRLLDHGCRILTAGHALSGAERCFSQTFGGISHTEVVAATLRLFGQGIKVAVEISLMARDAGLVAFGQPIIAIGGSGRGADASIILTPGTSAHLLDTKIHAIICKPDLFDSPVSSI